MQEGEFCRERLCINDKGKCYRHFDSVILRNELIVLCSVSNTKICNRHSTDNRHILLKKNANSMKILL